MFLYCSLSLPTLGDEMAIQVEAVLRLSDTELLASYHRARCAYAENKFARDTELSRLDWQSARLFATAAGRVTERQNAVKTSEALAKGGQHVRELSRDLDLLKADIDLMAMVLRTRGAAPYEPGPLKADHTRQ